MGARSLPGRYGGWDTVVTELAPRLVDRGCSVDVYCQPRYAARPRSLWYRGVRVVYVPALKQRSLEALSHETASMVHASFRNHDVIYVLGMRATPMWASALSLRRKLFFNTDGFDWQRRKWSPTARRYLRWSERVGVRIAGSRLICDNRAVAGYFAATYAVEPAFIPNGGTVVAESNPALLGKYGLEPGGYFLVVARIEPENNVDAAIDAFAQVKTDKTLAIVGGTNFRSSYLDGLRALAPANVRFLGAVYEPQELTSLYWHSLAYIHGHEVGGTNPALLQAMGARCRILAHDVPYNREVLESGGLYWKPRAADLRLRLEQVINGEAPTEAMRDAAVGRVHEHYDWEDIADKYVDYFREALAQSTTSAMVRIGPSEGGRSPE
jgi:glycosyltransferase involved in cell wall biosynthesis